MNIDFIYFDVGGVAILDFSKTNKWNEMLDNMGIKESNKEELNKLFDIEEHKCCSGEKDIESFVEILKNQFGAKLPEDYLFLDDFVNRFESNPLLGKIIQNLKNKYKIGLLTNMFPNMLDRIRSKGLLPNIEWDVIVDSSEVGFQKPQTEIFSLAVAMAGIPADRILFIENSKTHTATANKLGWNTFLYDPSDIENSNEKLLELLSN